MTGRFNRFSNHLYNIAGSSSNILPSSDRNKLGSKTSVHPRVSLYQVGEHIAALLISSYYHYIYTFYSVTKFLLSYRQMLYNKVHYKNVNSLYQTKCVLFLGILKVFLLLSITIKLVILFTLSFIYK